MAGRHGAATVELTVGALYPRLAVPQFIPWLEYLPIAGAALALLCLWGAFRAGRRVWLVDNLPTSKTTGIFIGLVEVKGTAESERPLKSYLAEQPCVHYDWNVKEHWSRTVTETYTDSEGRTQTRTRHESGWTTVDRGGESIPFYLKDDCGAVLVVPAEAKIEPITIFDETCGTSDPLYYGRGPAAAISDSDYRRQFCETAIPLHAPLYVMGQAKERTDLVAPQICAAPNAPMFLISTRTEEQVSAGLHHGLWGWGILGLALAVGGFVGGDLALHVDLARHWPIYLSAAGGYVLAGMLAWLWLTFNSLIDLRNRVRQAWSQVEVQLKRRHDLIPNLVQAVKGFRDYEQTLQTELAAMRTQLTATPPGVAGPDYQAVNKMVALMVERYPDLKANELFLNLQKNLIDTEQRIALGRGYFNEIATHYNTRLQVVPDRFVAALAAMKPQPLMAANDFERAAVQVSFHDDGQSNTGLAAAQNQ